MFSTRIAKSALLASLAAAATFTATPALAADLELALALDSSGSIGATNFNLQRNAYISALSDPTVLPTNGSVAIGIYQFASTTTTVFSMAEITAANLPALIAALTGMVYAGGGTNAYSAIDAARAQIFGNAISSNRQLIDVSTDGITGGVDTRAAALAQGIDQINCLGIGAGSDCTTIQAGPGAFSVLAPNFDAFEAALRAKIKTEVTGGVPEPTTWAMMLLGFGLIGGAMRRKQKVAVRYAF